MSFAPDDTEWLDGSLYPDVPVPETLATLEDRIDFIARVCGAWDFGIMPRPETLRELRRPAWKQAVDETQMLTSCAYHLLREYHGLPEARYLGPVYPHIVNDPCFEQV